MRIIRGRYKGKKIQAPKNLRARPTTDFAKESLFNILANSYDFEGLSVLDLFAGTGNISYEFLSRGAEEIWAVDMDRAAVKFMHQFKEQNTFDQLKIVHANTYAFLRTCLTSFDIVYADPPYKHKHVSKLHEKIFDSQVLKKNTLLIIEHGPETEYTDSSYLTETRKYGNVNFSFFKYEQ